VVTSDTSERGLEDLIVAAMTGSGAGGGPPPICPQTHLTAWKKSQVSMTWMNRR